MSKPDSITRLFEAGDAPGGSIPIADPVFRASVMRRVAMRRLQFELVAWFAAGLLLLAGLWVALPLLIPAIREIGAGLASASLELGLTAVLVLLGHLWLSGRLNLPDLRWFE